MQRHFAYRNQNSSELALPRAVFLDQSNNPTDMYDRSLSASSTEIAEESFNFFANLLPALKWLSRAVCGVLCRACGNSGLKQTDRRLPH